MIYKIYSRKQSVRAAAKILVIGIVSSLAGISLFHSLGLNAEPDHSKSHSSLQITNPTSEERELICTLNSPQKVAEWMHKNLKYDEQYDKHDSLSTVRSFRRVLRDRKAHCLEGAIFAATILREYNYPPLIICISAENDSDHNIFVYKQDGKIGSIAISSSPFLWDRPPIYSSVRELIESYYDGYLDAEGNKSMVGYSQLLNLNQFLTQDINWVASEQELREIEHSLWNLYYVKLFPRDKKEYYKVTEESYKVQITDLNVIQASDFEF